MFHHPGNMDEPGGSICKHCQAPLILSKLPIKIERKGENGAIIVMRAICTERGYIAEDKAASGGLGYCK